MTIKNANVPTEASRQSGNSVIIVLVVLIVAAVGVLAYMSGKIGSMEQKASDSPAAEVAQSEGTTPADEKSDPVVARVDGAEIKRSEVITLANAMPPQMQQIPMEQLLPIMIDQLVNNKIIDSKSKNANLESNPEVLKQVANAKEQIIRGKFVEDEISKQINDERLKKKYEDYVKNFPDVQEVKAAHILVDKEDKAKEIIKKLDDGAAFADMAKENSKDGTAKNGGELGYFTKQDVVPAFADAAFETKVGTYTKAPVKSDFGYHIIKVEDKRKRPAASFEEAKAFLEQEVRREILDETIKKWRDSAKIERFDLNGNPLPEKQEPAAGGAAAEKSAAAEPSKSAAE